MTIPFRLQPRVRSSEPLGPLGLVPAYPLPPLAPLSQAGIPPDQPNARDLRPPADPGFRLETGSRVDSRRGIKPAHLGLPRGVPKPAPGWVRSQTRGAGTARFRLGSRPGSGPSLRPRSVLPIPRRRPSRRLLLLLLLFPTAAPQCRRRHRRHDVSLFLCRAVCLLDNLDVARRHALRLPALLHLDPSVAWILLNQHEPLTLLHVVFQVALRRVWVKGFDVFEFPRPPLRCHCRALLLRRRGRSDGRPRITVRGSWSCRATGVLRRDGGWRRRLRLPFDVRRRHEALFVSCPNFDPTGTVYLCHIMISSVELRINVLVGRGEKKERKEKRKEENPPKK